MLKVSRTENEGNPVTTIVHAGNMITAERGVHNTTVKIARLGEEAITLTLETGDSLRIEKGKSTYDIVNCEFIAFGPSDMPQTVALHA